MQATVDAGQTMAFSPTAHAMLNDVSAFAGTITGFAKGNILDLASTVGTGRLVSRDLSQLSRLPGRSI